ncbi:uncharacterized protein N7479_009178 [Penicillium vulpinum]|uniref:Uncharacterized protein n=1 Tax=Penicillium vulpinum TaxID=29845 RepID=A0A1V6RW45_9EURO|nr:uncharacterized protein N7479_009178 [Penicillium vulpinum]KAJ5950765.1 hypothetical protein N7479_009178 [Penicillium vulpinum]OQE05866.1 hypothetical protein PENVUL_c021G10013 [Penicillium vulpinum]
MGLLAHNFPIGSHRRPDHTDEPSSELAVEEMGEIFPEYRLPSTICGTGFSNEHMTKSSSASWDMLLHSLATDSERANVASIMAAENLGFRDIIKYGIILMGSAIDSESFERALCAPLKSWTEYLAETLGDLDIGAVCSVGMRFLASLQGPADDPFKISRSLTRTRQLLDPPVHSTFPTTPWLTFAPACVINAHLLSIPLADIMNPNTRSSFSCVSSPVVLASSLSPTWEQLTIPHYRYIDTLPWPSVRSRLIISLHSNPPMIDHGEFANDLVNNGVRCWISSPGSWPGADAPWHARCWEVMPWFSDRWRLIFQSYIIDANPLYRYQES